MWAALPSPARLDSAPLAFGRAPRPLPGQGSPLRGRSARRSRSRDVPSRAGRSGTAPVPPTPKICNLGGAGGTPTSICSRPAAAGGGARSMHRAPAADRPGCRLLPALPLRLPCSRALSSPAGQPPPRPPQPSILLTSKSGCSGSPTRAPPLFSLSSFLPRYSGRAVRFSPGAAPGPLRRAWAPPGTRG